MISWFATIASGQPRQVRRTGRFHYQLEPVLAGKHLIRSVSIEFVDSGANSEGKGEPALIETEPLEVNVRSEFAGQAPSLANLEPMVPPQSVPQANAARWTIAACIAGVALLAVMAIRRRKRKVIEPRRQTPE